MGPYGFAAEGLIRHRRVVVLDAIGRFRDEAPFGRWTVDPSESLIADLQMVVRAIAAGLDGNAASGHIVIPELRQAIIRHVAVRRGQGFDPSLVVREYHVLGDTMLQFIQKQSRQVTFSATDAFEVIRRLNGMIDLVIRIAVDSGLQWRSASDSVLPARRPSGSNVSKLTPVYRSSL